MIPTLIVIIFVLWLSYEIKKSDRHNNVEKDRFWARELEANHVRKKDISQLDYIIIPIEKLPFTETEDSRLIKIQDTMRMLADRKILNLSSYTNTDLKLMYGVANLTYLSECDQNFILLSRTLCSWGQHLYEQQDFDNARSVLEYAVSCKADQQNIYLLLANIYAANKQFDKIDALISEAEQLDTLLKSSIIKGLNDIRQTK